MLIIIKNSAFILRIRKGFIPLLSNLFLYDRQIKKKILVEAK